MGLASYAMSDRRVRGADDNPGLRAGARAWRACRAYQSGAARAARGEADAGSHRDVRSFLAAAGCFAAVGLSRPDPRLVLAADRFSDMEPGA